ncbi:MAG: SDR family oxidoreductase [Bacteroidetes bacterium]|jgi:3-oxoacyl-[acyl-carrier protein] reductase|nr:SDR family oxidoreductase [Bacteroidota bacterium]
MTPGIVWITGASTGIGRALADTFHEAGWTVVVSSRGVAKLRSWSKTRTRAVAIACDVRREASVQKAFAQIVKRTGLPDVVINNAGVTSFRTLTETTTAEYRAIIETNLTGPFLIARAIVPRMQRRRSGMIVNILSYAAKAVYTRSSVYGASKAGADMLMRVLRDEVRHDGIRVLNVFPGAVETPMWPEALRAKYAGQMMPVVEVAQAILQAIQLPPGIMPEELVLRPQIGDLRV